jgi:hypothetical protein
MSFLSPLASWLYRAAFGNAIYSHILMLQLSWPQQGCDVLDISSSAGSATLALKNMKSMPLSGQSSSLWDLDAP